MEWREEEGGIEERASRGRELREAGERREEERKLRALEGRSRGRRRKGVEKGS